MGWIPTVRFSKEMPGVGFVSFPGTVHLGAVDRKLSALHLLLETMAKKQLYDRMAGIAKGPPDVSTGLRCR